MKKFTKLFLLALCSGFLFLGFSNAQSGIHENPYIAGDNTAINTEDSGINKNVISISDSINGMNLIGDSNGMMACPEWITIVAWSYLLLILIGLYITSLIPIYNTFVQKI